MKANTKDMTEDEWMNYREAGEGESYTCARFRRASRCDQTTDPHRYRPGSTPGVGFVPARDTDRP